MPLEMSLLFLALLPIVQGAAAPQPAAVPVALAAQPAVTPSATKSDPSKTKRDVGDTINSVLGGLGSAIPSYVASGVANFFQDFPSGEKVRSSLGLDDEQIAALPTEVLNIP